jgi:hypothetical protein
MESINTGIDPKHFSDVMTSPNYPNLYSGGLHWKTMLQTSDSSGRIWFKVNVLDIECDCTVCSGIDFSRFTKKGLLIKRFGRFRILDYIF